MTKPDEARGVYRKYVVTRTDGSTGPGGKHEHCAYFVLDLEHDEFAGAALRAYARACRKTYPKLADDILTALEFDRSCGCREAYCPHVSGLAPNSSSEMVHRMMGRAEEPTEDDPTQ